MVAIGLTSTPNLMRAIRFFLVTAAICLTACASTPRTVSVHYSAPSVAPVRESVRSVKDSIDRADKIAVALQLAIPKPQFDALTHELLIAQQAASDADVQISNLEQQIVVVTDAANNAAAEKNVALARADKLDAQRRSAVGQRNRFFVALIVAGLWIFKGPLLSASGFVLRKFAGLP
jgi:hypothetical protein